MQRWTCPFCKSSYTTKAVVLPVRCKCGRIDYSSDNIKNTEGDPAAPVKPIIGRYAAAVRRWMEAGKPVRTDDEVDALLSTHCAACELFQDNHCRQCGCKILSSQQDKQAVVGWLISPALANKLRMATEHCPIGKW